MRRVRNVPFGTFRAPLSRAMRGWRRGVNLCAAQQALWLVANAVCERYARAASGLVSMRRVGLEPTRLATQEPKSCLSANSNIGAAKAAAGPYALPQLPTTSIFCITYAFTFSIAGAQYFFGSKSSGCAAICSFTPSVKAIRRSVA